MNDVLFLSSVSRLLLTRQNQSVKYIKDKKNKVNKILYIKVFFQIFYMANFAPKIVL